MNVREILPSILPWLRRKPVMIAGAIVAALLGFGLVLKASRPAAQAASFFEVKRGDFLISIVEGGTLEAVREEIIRSEVEGTARIIYIVPEGSYVKKDAVLVELDSSASQDAVNVQLINVEKAQFAVIQAEQQLEIQKSVVDSETDAAQLKVEFAQTDLEKYAKGEAEQLRRNAQIEITNVIENLQIATERLEWTEKLYAKGYETKSNLDKDRLTVSQSKLKLEQASKALWMLQTFDEPKKRRELEAALQEAKEDLDRVKLQGDGKLAQARADLDAQKSTLELNKKKLERDQRQLLATKVKAPQDGMVVYPSGSGRFSSESMIEEGAVVRNRQELIKLPDTSEMKLQVKIHESHINHVRLGQPAYIVLDAMPDQRFRGMVSRVAPLPDSMSRFGNPNLKVYATEILVQDKLPDVKPGVSARAEIIITNLQQVLTVPIQAITTRKGQQVAFLSGNPPKPTTVSVGMYNNKFIEITSGLKPGDRVLLSPPFDTEEKDLGGAIMAAGETPPSVTNQPGRIPDRQREQIQNGLPDETRRGPGLPGGAETALVSERGNGANGSGEAVAVAEGPARQFGQRGPRAPGQEGGEAMRGPRGEGQGGPGGRFNREEMLKQFDKNGDGELDDAERTAMRQASPRGEGQGGPGRVSREEMIKQFDTNGDGQLDETERTAMRERFGRDRRRQGGPTNAAPEGARNLRPDESN